MKYCFFFFLLFLLSAQPVQSQSKATILQLIAHSQEHIPNLGLTANEWSWLRKRQKIRFAIWHPIAPPYDITSGLHDYGGINGDVLGLIAENLAINIEIQLYESYNDAIEALKQGKADLIAQAGDNELKANMLLSIPYSKNTPAIVTNIDNSSDNQNIFSIAVAPDYNAQSILANYPNAKIVEFTSSRHALEALAFRQIDLFISDTVTAQYLINQSNLSNLRVHPLKNIKIKGFSFATFAPQGKWISIINKVLLALPDNLRVEIHRRWNGGIPLSLNEHQLTYTSLEQKWMEEHKNINVAIAMDNAPIGFFAPSGQLRGIIADILTALQQRTQLKFIIQKYPTQEQALNAVKNGQSDIIAGTTQESVWLHDLLATRAWLYNSWVMVGRKNHSSIMQSQHITVLKGEAPEKYLRQYSTTNFIERIDTWRKGLAKVEQGKSDMMIMPLIIANSQLSTSLSSTLKILSSLDTEPMRFVLGASQQNYPLVTILNKALRDIPPEDLHAIIRNWYDSNSNLIWPNEKTECYDLIEILKFTLAGGLIILLFGLFYFYLHYQQKKNLTALINAIPIPFYISDKKHYIIAANIALLRALNISEKEIYRTQLSKWLPIQKEHQANAYLIKRASSILKLWHLAIFPEKKHNTHYIGGWIDITRQKAIINALRQAKHQANHANKVKSSFLATMSHEIRTPISAIIGMLELVLHRTGNTMQNQQSIRIAYDAAQSLLSLIGNILDISRIESDKLVLRPERASLRTLIETSAVLFEGLAAQKGLQFQLEIDTDINTDVLIDSVRFKQILANLLGNALKFTHRGSITLQAQAKWQDTTHIVLQLSIEDTGEGIDPQILDRLFLPFEQGNSNQIAQGSGLGLYICHTLVHMMDGTITFDSTVGEGSRIIVTLMLPKMAATNHLITSSPSSPISRTLKILIVDDNPVSRLLLTQQLNYLGHQVLSSENGQQALQLLQQQSVDMVITDCNMPIMDGYELARKLREFYPKLIILGVSADAQCSTSDTCRQVGMDDCLFKPITLSLLEDKLNNLLMLMPDEQPTLTTKAQRDSLLSQSTDLTLNIHNFDLFTPEQKVEFLMLQIEVIDETLAKIAQWQENPSVPLRETLHWLRGGMQLLGTATLVDFCLKQEQNPTQEGIAQLVQEIHKLRTMLITLSHHQRTTIDVVIPTTD